MGQGVKTKVMAKNLDQGLGPTELRFVTAVTTGGSGQIFMLTLFFQRVGTNGPRQRFGTMGLGFAWGIGTVDQN